MTDKNPAVQAGGQNPGKPETADKDHRHQLRKKYDQHKGNAQHGADQQRVQRVEQAKQEGIADRGFYGIVIPGLKDQRPVQAEHPHNTQHDQDIFENRGQGDQPLVKHQQIPQDQHTRRQIDQPKLRRLLEIALEGSPEGADHAAGKLVPQDLQQNIVHGGDRRADGENRDAENQHHQIQRKEITEFVCVEHEFAVGSQKIPHSYCRLSCCV